MTQSDVITPSNRSCSVCDSSEVDVRTETEFFLYGADESAVELSANVQVYRCQDCGFEFTDSSAERAKQSAICRHLGVLTPDKIAGIRKQYGVSRAEFARLTKIGEASINRWENGQLIQSAAMDQYLILLSYGENFQKIRTDQNFLARPNWPETAVLAPTEVSDRFNELEVTPELLAKAQVFRLHPDPSNYASIY